MTVYHAALRCGLSVPEDLSIIGASHETIDGLDRPIATLLLPSVEVGRQAVDLLTRKIHRPGRELPAVAVPFGEGRFASTTAPPPPT
jgi:DNA-binding LacI/PurR family transcriptional regulator